MPTDQFGIEQKDAPTSADYLGVQAAQSFKGQPTLPSTVGGPGGSTSSAPQTVAGAGKAPTLADFGFADLASGAMGGPVAEPGGGGGPGGGEGGAAAVGVGPGSFESFSVQSGPFGLSGNPFGLQGSIGPVGLNVGLAGISPNLNLTNNSAVNAAINAAGKQGLNFAGIPSSLTASFLSNLAQAPAIASLFAGAVSAMSPFSILSLVHNIASMSPSTLAGQAASLSGQISSVMADPQLTPEMQSQLLSQLAQQLQAVNAQGPRVGGPQAIGNLTIDNPVTNLATNSTPSPSGAAAQSFTGELSPTFAALANALGLGTGRNDTGPGGPGPAGAAPSSSPGAEGPAGLGEGGPGPGTGEGTGPAAGEGSGASGPGGDAAW